MCSALRGGLPSKRTKHRQRLLRRALAMSSSEVPAVLPAMAHHKPGYLDPSMGNAGDSKFPAWLMG